MLLDKPNAELLKLIAVCKDFPAVCHFHDTHILSEMNIGRLLDEELLILSNDSRRYRVTTLGYELLNVIGFKCEQDVFRETDTAALTRREQSAQVMLMLLLAGIDVFASTFAEMSNDRRYMNAGNIRRYQRASNQNVSGNTRFTGLTGGSGYVFYYISDPYGKLFYESETRIIRTLLALARTRSAGSAVISPAVIYTGESYRALCSAVTGPAGKKASYRTAYDNFTMPVYLCPCTPDGTFQMRIMLQPDYRARLIKMLYPIRGLAPPDLTFAGCDGIHKGEPVILGVDMDLHRINAVADAARKAGKRAHIFSRPCQTDALMAAIGNTGVCFYNIQDNEILDLFSFSSLIEEPPGEPYITPKGGYIDDKTIRACKADRKSRGAKGKAVSEEGRREDG